MIRWEDVLAEKGAWDALIWFGGLVMMASQLNTLGFMKWFATTVGSSLAGWSWFSALIVLMLVYFYSHYGFASTDRPCNGHVPGLSGRSRGGQGSALPGRSDSWVSSQP